MGERKKISLTELDESSIVASFKEEQPALAVPPTVEPETPAPRQTEQPDIKPAHESKYLRLFIHESPVCARLGKTIYLRKEFHERIQRIVQTIGGNRVSLFSYVDNVLEKHFADWQGDIEREYEQRNTGIF